MVTGRNKFDTFYKTSESHIPNDIYESFVTAYIEEAAECIPTKPRGRYRIPWESISDKEKQDNMKNVYCCNTFFAYNKEY